MDSAALTIVLPLFGIMLAGYVTGRFRIFNDNASDILSRFVLVIAMPALIFISLSKVPVTDFFDWPFLGALGGGMLITMSASMLIARFAFPGSLTAVSFHGLTAMFSSTGYIGLPIILIAFGDTALVPAIIGAVITGMIFFPITIVFSELDKSGGSGRLLLSPLVAILKNPVILATIAGLTVSALGLDVPKPFATFCDLLGGAYIPCALFSAGLFMVNCRVQGDLREISWLVLVKLAIHPLITWWLAFHVFELKGLLPAIAVLQAALPTGVPVFVLAQQYRTFVDRSNAVIFVSTALSIFTLAGLLAFFAK